MTMKSLIFAALLAFGGLPIFAEDESPIVSPRISSDNSPATLAAAKERGAAAAARDIKAGTLRILYWGIPWSVGKPLVDEATGYRVQVIAGCVVGEAFTTEVQAYNSAMRDWHARPKAATAPK